MIVQDMFDIWAGGIKEDSDLKKAFEVLDENGDGFLAPDEIEKFAAKTGIPITQEDIGKLKKILDNPKRGLLRNRFVYQVIL